MKGIKIHCSHEGAQCQLLIVSYFLNEDTRAREYVEVYASPEITIYNEFKLIVIDKKELLENYFDVFDFKEFDKQSNKIRTDKVESPQKQFENYLFKKTPKIKNVIYLAVKFPEVIELYANANKNFFQEGRLKSGFSQQLMEDSKVPEYVEQENLISNYINPESKILVKINCNINEVNCFINKSFTSEISIIVGDSSTEIPPHLVRITDLDALKKDYNEYCSKIELELKKQGGVEDENEVEEEADLEESSDSNSYKEDDDRKIRKKKANKKKDEKFVAHIKPRVSIPDAVRSASKQMRGTKKKEGSGTEESLFNEEDIEDESDRPVKKTRAAMADKRKKEKLKEKGEEKIRVHDTLINKFNNNDHWDQKMNAASFNPMGIPIGIMEGAQMMGAPSFGYPQMTAQMPGGKAPSPAMFLHPSMLGGQAEKKAPQQASQQQQTSSSDKEKSKNSGASSFAAGMSGLPNMAGMQGLSGMGQYGMPIMVPPEMLKSMLASVQMQSLPSGMGGMVPPGLGGMSLGGLSNPASSQQPSGPKIQSKNSQDKSEESRLTNADNLKKQMETYAQMTMYGSPMFMPGMTPPSNQTSSNAGRPTQQGHPMMQGGLPQNGPFIMVPSGQMQPRPPYEQKKSEGANQPSQEKKDEKRSPSTPFSSFTPQMPESGSGSHPSQMSYGMNQPEMQQALYYYEQQMQQMYMQQLQQQQFAMMSNPYNFMTGATGGQGSSMPSMSSMSGMPNLMSPGSMGGAQSPFGMMAMPSLNKPPASDIDFGSKNKDNKDDDKNKPLEKKPSQPPGFPMMHPGGFYMAPMGGMTGQLGSQGMPQMTMQQMQQIQQMMSSGQFGMPPAMIGRDTQQNGGSSTSNPSW